jgi:hypothetical protein
MAPPIVTTIIIIGTSVFWIHPNILRGCVYRAASTNLGNASTSAKPRTQEEVLVIPIVAPILLVAPTVRLKIIGLMKNKKQFQYRLLLLVVAILHHFLGMSCIVVSFLFLSMGV